MYFFVFCFCLDNDDSVFGFVKDRVSQFAGRLKKISALHHTDIDENKDNEISATELAEAADIASKHAKKLIDKYDEGSIYIKSWVRSSHRSWT